MENQFLDIDDRWKRTGGMRPRCGNGYSGAGLVPDSKTRPSAQMSAWETTFAAQDRSLVILIENGGIDLGIPEFVDSLLSALPGSSLLPDSLRTKLIEFIREKIKKFTDNLLESVELAANRYTAAKPDFYGNVTVLRDSTASYQDLKNKLIALSGEGKIVDLLVLTHGRQDLIAVAGGIDSAKIRAMKTENGRPLPLRSVYMMNCVGSSLNQAWLDAGAKVSSGAIRNNYLPEPTTFFFWNAWKAGQTFETAVTSAYRKTINLMKDTVRTYLSTVPGGDVIAGSLDFENMNFVKDSAPVILGQSSVTINTDDLTFTQSLGSQLATTVVPVSQLRTFGASRAASTSEDRQSRSLSPQGVDFIKQWEGFRSTMYNDQVGHCTIGYGTLLHTGNCDGRASEQPYANGISEDAATQLLAQRAGTFQQVLNDSVTVPLGQNQNDALVSFIYNVGGEAFRHSTLLTLLNQGHPEAVPGELKKWTKARQNGNLVDLPGLVKRRAAEAELFQKPDTAAAQSFSLYARSFGSIDYSIPGILPVLAQPTPNTCWAAVYTMMYSWKTNSSVTIANALARLGATYVDMFNRDRGLDSNTAQTLYADAGLEPLYSFNPTIDGWVSLLRKYGPLYVDVGYNNPNAGTHAIIVTGISGDGSPDGTSMTYVDPINGSTKTLKFRDFLAKFEPQSAVTWPYTIVHWPVGTSIQNSVAITQSSTYYSPSNVVAQATKLSYSQNPAAAVVAGMEIADAAQIGLGAIAVVQAQVSASQGSFSLSYDKAQRLLTNEARQQMPGAQSAKKSYSLHLLQLDTGKFNGANADIIIEWDGNDYGEIGTPVIRRNLSTSTEWSKSSANVTITKLDRIPLPKTDPRTWPIVYSYEGTCDPWGNGYFEFSGEFEINAFGGLKFNRHEVVSRAFADWAMFGKPADYIRKGADVVVPVPAIPQEQIAYLRTKLP